MTQGHLFLGVNNGYGFNLVYYDTLLQNAYYIFITYLLLLFLYYFISYFIPTCVTFSLKNSAVVTNREDFITKSDSYYKMRYLLQNALVEEKRKEVFSVNKDWSFFSINGFLSQTLTNQRTERKGRGPSFIPLCHFHPLMNIEKFICNFAFEMAITYL